VFPLTPSFFLDLTMRAKSYFLLISFYIAMLLAQVQGSVISDLFKFLNSEAAPLIDALPVQDATQLLSLLTSNVTVLVPM